MRTKNFIQMATLVLGMTISSVMITSCTAEDNPVGNVPGDVPSVGAEQKQDGNWTYTDYGTYTLIKGYTGSDKTKLTSLIFPEQLGGKKVMGITYDFRFSEFTNLETLNINNGAMINEMPSMQNCTKLAHINIVDYNGAVLSRDCLPNIVERVPSYCFKGTAITTLDLRFAKSVGSSVFRDCNSLQEVRVPKEAVIEEGAFSYIPSICEINYNIKVTDLTWQMIAFSPNLYVKCSDGAIGWCGDGDASAQDFLYWSVDKNCDLTIACAGDGWSNFQDKQIIKTRRWNDWATKYIKSIHYITLSQVYAIGVNEFKGLDKVTIVTLNDGLTSIGASAFEDCQCLINITIPASVTNIGANAFKGCKSLETVTILGNPTIGDGAFPDGATVIYNE